MAGTAPLALVIALCMTVVLSQLAVAAEADVAISVENTPVVTGGILAIQCKVLKFQQDNFKINLFRVLDIGTEQLTNGNTILQPSMDIFLATRAFPDGSVVYFFTILDISSEDNGRYICKVLDDRIIEYIADDSIDIQIYSHPGHFYPRCSSVPGHPVIVNVDDTLKLKCTSEKGSATIQTKWINTKTQKYISTRNTTVGNLVYSESSILVDISLQNVMFACEATSGVFSDWKRLCTVGPIKVNSYTDNNKIVSNAGSRNTHSQNIHNQQLHGNCVECTSDDMLQFHLTIAIVVTVFIAIIFLILTILLCYKFHQQAPIIRRPPSKALTPQQSVEPVYVSLQRRSVNADREYMTLEDPYNPDNKIIVPRETFDEYCKTMKSI